VSNVDNEKRKKTLCGYSFDSSGHVRGDRNSDHVMCAAGISDGCRILYHVTVCLLQGRSRPSQADIIPLHTGTR
jgi:hypothetical protein